ILLCVLCFFFQAEDGIRDRNVTGVQTCALPIFCRIDVKVALNSSSAIISTSLFSSESKRSIILSKLKAKNIPAIISSVVNINDFALTLEKKVSVKVAKNLFIITTYFRYKDIV